MATNVGYPVQLVSPEGDKIVPIVSTEGLYDENGQKVDLSSLTPDLDGLPVSDIRKLTIRDGESINAGDVVNVGAASDGEAETVYKDVVAQDNVENVIWRNAINSSDTCVLNSMYSIFAYSVSNTGGYVMLIDNTTGKQAGADATIFVSQAGVSSVSLALLDDSHFVVCYEANEMVSFKVGTVSGTSISFGTEYNPGWGDTDSNPHYATVITIGTNTVFCCYNWGTEPEYAILTVSGTSISATVSRQSLANIASRIAYISACLLPDDASGNKRICICFSDTGDGNKGKAVIATIDSSNAVTFGEVSTFIDNGSVTETHCASDSAHIVVIANIGTKILDFSLAAVSDVSLGHSTTSVINLSDNQFIFINGGGGMPSSARTLSITNGQGALGNNFVFNTGASLRISACKISDNKVLAAYADVGNSSYGTTTILTVEGNQIAGSFIDNSQDAIALADGTGGQEIPVGFGGYCECPGVTEGQQITSDGVSAFSPLDGWLKIVYPLENDIVTGSFTADTTLQTIDLGFSPTCVLVYRGDTNNTNSSVANSQATGSAYYDVRIFTKEYISAEFGCITENGFLFLGKTSQQTHFVAWR